MNPFTARKTRENTSASVHKSTLTRSVAIRSAFIKCVPLVLLALPAACSSEPQPVAPNPQLSGLEVAAPSKSELIFSGVAGKRGQAQTITLKNVGGEPLELRTLNLDGPNAAAFNLSQTPQLPHLIEAHGSLSTEVIFSPEAAGSQQASLEIASGDPSHPSVTIDLYGLSSRGEQGNNEPSLQQIADTLGYRIDVGGSALRLSSSSAAIGDEQLSPMFEKAGSGPVSLKVVARYSPAHELPYGYFTLEDNKAVRHEVGRSAATGSQMLLPSTTGSTFDPGDQPFGLYGYDEQTQYSLDALNSGSISHALRVYPLRDRRGNPTPHSYLIGLEEAQNADYQDAVFVITNVKPSSASLPNLHSLEGWQPLFNGQNLDGWYSYLPGHGKNSDPEGVFKVENGMLHILDVARRGQRDFGYLATEASYQNYHLRLEYKWGTKRFAPRASAKRDSGVMYHVSGPDRIWPTSIEYQIQEGDTGDFWLIGGTSIATTVASTTTDEPQYREGGTPYTTRPGSYVRLASSGTYDSRSGWNTVDIIVRGSSAVHMVNGKVNNRASSIIGADGEPLTSGRILLQAEGAEIYYRNIEIRPLGQ